MPARRAVVMPDVSHLDTVHQDNVRWCTAFIRPIVAVVACPRCKSGVGNPCRNLLALTEPDKKRGRKPRPFYKGYVHAERTKAFKAWARQQHV